MHKPLFSISIPAYNRAVLLPPLLDSILAQNFDDYEIVIAEDGSPEREKIRAVVEAYSICHPGLFIYVENATNLGYDANIRNLCHLAQGEYLLFMGNDDLLCAGALAKIAAAVLKYPDVGVVLRSYAAFDGTPDNIVQISRYFANELFFPAGPETSVTIYRRSVVISGMVIHRESATSVTTERFDGTLLYQLYLVATILLTKNAVHLPDILVLYRNGGIPDFGTSPAEQGRFVPQAQTPASSLHFVQSMLDIAKYVESHHSVKIFQPVLRDIANYSYPLLAIQSGQPLTVFVHYLWELARMGLGWYLLFWGYALSILLLGTRRVDRLIRWIKGFLGYTPTLGKVYQGVIQGE
ncbi:MAG: glycosyltransferase family 2 protein [Magnetococcus sp. YQC-5]